MNNKLTKNDKRPIVKINRKKSPFVWPFLETLLVILFLLSLQERSWSRIYSQEIQTNLDQLAKITSENQLIFAKVSSIYQKEQFETLGFKQPETEFFVIPSLSRK